MKKNRLNEQEMDQIAGGWFREPEHNAAVAGGFETAVSAVNNAAETTFEIVRYVLFG